MLILTRKVGESLRINNDVSVTIVGIQGLQTRIGVQAPANIEVHREEVFQRIQDKLASSGPAHIDDWIKKVAAEVDPRKAFVALNPAGFAAGDMAFYGTGFDDKYVQSAYLLFLSGYRAALEVGQ